MKKLRVAFPNFSKARKTVSFNNDYRQITEDKYLFLKKQKPIHNT